MKPFLIICSLLFFVLGVSATNKKHPLLKQTGFESAFTLASNGKFSSPGIGAMQYWGVAGTNNKISLGLGARMSASFGSNKLTYTTAPASLRREATGLPALLTGKMNKNIDTLELESTQINTLNVSAAFRYTLATKWSAELNVDLGGFSFGGSRDATLIYGEASDASRRVTAKPTKGNLLLLGDNNRGSLNTQLMCCYQYNQKLKIKTGASLFTNEYTIDRPVLYRTTNGVVVDADRFRTRAITFCVGFLYLIHQNK